MTFFVKALPLGAALAAVLLISGCDKKEAAVDETPVTNSDSATENSTATEANTVVVDKETAASDKQATESNGAVLPTTAGAEASAGAQAQPSLMSNPVEPNTPEAKVKAAIDTLYYGDAKEAASYYYVDMKDFADELAKTQYAFQQTVTGVTITKTTYSDDKTQANVLGEIRLKGQTEPAPLAYTLQKMDGKWKILG